jgi:hypothetical protein
LSKKVTGVPEGRSYTNAKLGRELIFINLSNQTINFKVIKKRKFGIGTTEGTNNSLSGL